MRIIFDWAVSGPIPFLPSIPFLAQGEGAGAGAGDPGGGPGGLFSPPMILLMVGMFFVWWLLVIRPEGKRQRTREAMLKSVKKGDTVVTTAGIIGKVHRVDEKDLVLHVDTDRNVKIRFLRSAVNEILPGGKPADKDEKDNNV